MTERSILVTGAASGIGRSTALRLARDGYAVYAGVRSAAASPELEAGGCRVLTFDVTDETALAAAVRTIEAERGAVWALVNNAGYSQSGAIEAVSLDAVRRQFETNVFGLVRLTQLVLPGMRRARTGRIVNLSSMGGKLTFPGGGFYHATKYAVEAISDALRFEVKGFGVDVVIVEPGLIRTNFGHVASAGIDGAIAPETAAAYERFHTALAAASTEAYETGPLARMSGTPDDVAATIARALAAKRPRSRYTVAPSAKVLIGLRAALPDDAWDAFLASNIARPA